MLPEYYAVVGAIIASLGGFYYLYETIIGKTKPNKITFFLWGVLPMITFVAQRVQGVEGVSWATFVAGFTPLLILMASSFNKKSYWRTTPIDYICMALAIMGIVLWAITSNPNTAILFMIFADGSAALPTVIKSYRHPETESWIAYAISTFGFGISIFAINIWNFQNYAFISYLLLANGILALFSHKRPSKDPLLIDP